jgi:hypothetical protein
MIMDSWSARNLNYSVVSKIHTYDANRPDKNRTIWPREKENFGSALTSSLRWWWAHLGPELTMPQVVTSASPVDEIHVVIGGWGSADAPIRLAA